MIFSLANLACGVGHNIFFVGRPFFSSDISLADRVQILFSSFASAYGFALADKVFPVLASRAGLPSVGRAGGLAKFIVSLTASSGMALLFNEHVNVIRSRWL